MFSRAFQEVSCHSRRIHRDFWGISERVLVAFKRNLGVPENLGKLKVSRGFRWAFNGLQGRSGGFKDFTLLFLLKYPF